MIYNSDVIQSNVGEIWEQHTVADFQNGRSWYANANSFSLRLAAVHSVHPMQAAGVISALSPQKSWEANVDMATDFFRLGVHSVGHTGMQKQKANLIRRATSREDICKILGGLKTINFFNNIYDPKDGNWLTVDRHMIRIALQEDKLKLTVKEYEFLKKEYCIFARRISMIPCELQAILWVTIKRVKK